MSTANSKVWNMIGMEETIQMNKLDEINSFAFCVIFISHRVTDNCGMLLNGNLHCSSLIRIV